MTKVTTFSVLFLIGSMGLSIPAFADDTDGTIFYTLFVEGEPSNVKSLDYDYVSGTNTLTVMNIVAIGHTDDADGIVVNPQNPDLLIIGTAFNSTPLNSADDNLATVVIAGGAVATFSSPFPTFHLELADATTIYAAGLPGELVRFTINGDGSLSSGTQITFTAGSDDIDITQLITITDGPNAGKFFYTSSVPAGSGNFGELTFGLGDTATTTRIHSSLPAAHGGEYDPFSDTVIIVGSNHITQINPSDGSIIHDLVVTPPSGFIHFDQGIVDANGHIIIADNGGFLFLVDYPSGALSDGTTQVTSAFVEKFLDDIAPLIMPPEPNLGFFVGGGRVITPLSAGIDLIPKKPGDDTFILTHGFELHCDPSQGPNNLEVNWGGKKDGHRFHLEELESATCIDDQTPNEPPPSPHPGPTLDVYTGQGTGRYNGECGASAQWIMEDNGEPGKNDTIIKLVIFDAGGNLVLNIDDPQNPLNLKSGNHQWVPHPESHKNPPTQTTPC